jgi:uncharacterized protein
LRFENFSDGATTLELALQAEDLSLGRDEVEMEPALGASLRVFRAGETFTLTGQLRWTVTGECYRCLAPATAAQTVAVRLVIQRRRATADEQRAVAEDDEAALCDPGVPAFDLRPWLREIILVESPMRIACRDACRGLCPACGRDLNQGPCPCSSVPADPRWAALKDVRFT